MLTLYISFFVILCSIIKTLYACMLYIYFVTNRQCQTAQYPLLNITSEWRNK